MKIKILILVIVSLIVLAICQQIKIKNDAKHGYSLIEKKSLSGKITWVDTSSGLSSVYLDNETEKFRFTPIAIDINKKKDFFSIAKIGDSIVKRSHCDTLILVHESCRYKYTLRKY